MKPCEPGGHLDWSAWQEARKILCIRLDGMGDLLMTTPALCALKEASAERELVLMVSSGASEMAPLIPGVDQHLVYDAPWMKAPAAHPGKCQSAEMIRTLKSEEFDAAIIFTVYSQNPLPAALLSYLAGIPLRLAYCRENPYRLLSHWLPEPDDEDDFRHEVRRQLDLVAWTGASAEKESLSLVIPEEEETAADSFLQERGLDLNRRMVVIHPGATAPSRRYAPENFAAAAGRIAAELGCQIVFTGSAHEKELVEYIQNLMKRPSVSLAGEMSLARLSAVIRKASLLITNNTGPAHMAAAVGTPVVDLYALTNPQHTPWAVPSRVLYHNVPCKFCYKSVCPEGHQDCLQRVHPDAVLEAAEELLNLPKGNNGNVHFRDQRGFS